MLPSLSDSWEERKNENMVGRAPFTLGWYLNPFTPKSDQVQISPAASAVILHHTVWGIWLFIPYSDEKWLYYQILIASLIHFCIKGWENVLFELGSERVNWSKICHIWRIWLPVIYPNLNTISLLNFEILSPIQYSSMFLSVSGHRRRWSDCLLCHGDPLFLFYSHGTWKIVWNSRVLK